MFSLSRPNGSLATLVCLGGILLSLGRLWAKPQLELVATIAPPFGTTTPTQPIALTISPEDNLYLLDAQQAAIFRLNLQGELLDQIGGPGSSSDRFSDPADLSITSGLDLFVADWGNDRVVRCNRRLVYLSEYQSSPNASQDLWLEKPVSVVQGWRGDLFIADGGNDRILKIAATGEPIFSFGAFGEGKGSLKQPWRLELDPLGGLWVLDQLGQVVYFDEFGGFIEERQAVLAGRALGLAVSAEALWVCSDSLLWVWDRTERQSLCYTATQLGLPEFTLFADLAYRSPQLWVLEGKGRIYAFRIYAPP